MPGQYGREQGGQKEMKFETIDKRISSLEEAGMWRLSALSSTCSNDSARD